MSRYDGGVPKPGVCLKHRCRDHRNGTGTHTYAEIVYNVKDKAHKRFFACFIR